MSTFREQIETVVSEAAKKAGISKNALLLDVAVDTAEYRGVTSGKRPAPDTMLRKIASHEAMKALGVDFATFKAWQLAEKYPDEFVDFAKRVLEIQGKGF